MLLQVLSILLTDLILSIIRTKTPMRLTSKVILKSYPIQIPFKMRSQQPLMTHHYLMIVLPKEGKRKLKSIIIRQIWCKNIRMIDLSHLCILINTQWDLKELALLQLFIIKKETMKLLECPLIVI